MIDEIHMCIATCKTLNAFDTEECEFNALYCVGTMPSVKRK